MNKKKLWIIAFIGLAFASLLFILAFKNVPFSDRLFAGLILVWAAFLISWQFKLMTTYRVEMEENIPKVLLKMYNDGVITEAEYKKPGENVLKKYQKEINKSLLIRKIVMIITALIGLLLFIKYI